MSITSLPYSTICNKSAECFHRYSCYSNVYLTGIFCCFFLLVYLTIHLFISIYLFMWYLVMRLFVSCLCRLQTTFYANKNISSLFKKLISHQHSFFALLSTQKNDFDSSTDKLLSSHFCIDICFCLTSCLSLVTGMCVWDGWVMAHWAENFAADAFWADYILRFWLTQEYEIN